MGRGRAYRAKTSLRKTSIQQYEIAQIVHFFPFPFPMVIAFQRDKISAEYIYNIVSCYFHSGESELSHTAAIA